jgi:hypothetical protein
MGMLALMLSATGVTLMPKVASAQDGYYARGDNPYGQKNSNVLRAKHI